MKSCKNQEPRGRNASHEEDEVGVFVIWETARHLQNRILEDLTEHFEIRRVHEVQWSRRMIWANYQRFYSDLDVRGVYHQRNKGSGQFLAITLVDRIPIYDERVTGRGIRKVNTRFFDSKARYREWSGGLGIHCGETAWENDRDSFMLFGPELHAELKQATSSWNGKFETLRKDLTGARGWTSIEELCGAMQRTIRYVALDYDVAHASTTSLRDIPQEILTDDYRAAHTILSVGPLIHQPITRGGKLKIRLPAGKTRIRIRFPDDGHLDPLLARRLLDSRTQDSTGWYRPGEEEAFWLIAYYAVVYRWSMNFENRHRLAQLGAHFGFHDLVEASNDESIFRVRLLDLVSEQGLCPRTRLERSGRQDGSSRSRYLVFSSGIVTVIGKYLCDIRRQLSAPVKTLFFLGRDSAVQYLPWLSELKARAQSNRAVARRKDRNASSRKQ